VAGMTSAGNSLTSVKKIFSLFNFSEVSFMFTVEMPGSIIYIKALFSRGVAQSG
jgi:hypothetical protein